MGKRVKKENVSLLATCKCGSIPKVLKSNITKQYAAYQIWCPNCGAKGKLCSTEDCAVQCWNMGSGITGGNSNGTKQ